MGDFWAPCVRSKNHVVGYMRGPRVKSARKMPYAMGFTAYLTICNCSPATLSARMTFTPHLSIQVTDFAPYAYICPSSPATLPPGPQVPNNHGRNFGRVDSRSVLVVDDNAKIRKRMFEEDYWRQEDLRDHRYPLSGCTDVHNTRKVWIDVSTQVHALVVRSSTT